MRQALIPVAIVLARGGDAQPAGAQYNGVPKSGMMTKGGMPAGITPNELKKVSFDQELGVQVPLDLPFRDETGRAVQLSQYFTGRPVILALVYYECPMLCVQALNGLVKSLEGAGARAGPRLRDRHGQLQPGGDAAGGRGEEGRVRRAARASPGAADAWHFLTGTETSIRLLTDTVGFHYVYDAATKQYAHPTGMIVLTPEGKIVEVPVRHRLRPARPAPRARRGVGPQGGDAGRPAAALLLSLRPDDREVRPGADERPPARRRAHGRS